MLGHRERRSGEDGNAEAAVGQPVRSRRGTGQREERGGRDDANENRRSSR